jgi:large subunit ribosomal protein L22
MEITAVSKSVRVAPRKIRLVADAIRSFSVQNAIDALQISTKRGSVPLFKTLKSAVANAKNNNKIEIQNLIIKEIDVLEAPSFKRFHPSTRGRVHPYKRRGSHVRIVLTEKTSEIISKKEEHGTKS